MRLCKATLLSEAAFTARACALDNANAPDGAVHAANGALMPLPAPPPQLNPSQVCRTESLASDQS